MDKEKGPALGRSDSKVFNEEEQKCKTPSGDQFGCVSVTERGPGWLGQSQWTERVVRDELKGQVERDDMETLGSC